MPSQTAAQFAPGNFVTNGTSELIGVTLAIKDQTEDNPLILVRWIVDQRVEWVRSEYLYRQ
jgi:hypothetical protein